MTDDSSITARFVKIDSNQAGQRIDNFLIKHLKGVPRTRVYRCLRKGEVRVNGGRKKPTYRLNTGDEVRLPPLRVGKAVPVSMDKLIIAAADIPVIYSDDFFLIVNKPSGMAVHGGSGLEWGVIEAMRAAHPEMSFLELVHRLDRGTSGCLLLAKQRLALTELHSMLRQNHKDQLRISKKYLALLKGQFSPASADKTRLVDTPLSSGNKNARRKHVLDDPRERDAISIFKLLRGYTTATLVEIGLLTGRMHQARRHAQSIGHPIAGDQLYGDFAFNRAMKAYELHRIFLHAEHLKFKHPLTNELVDVRAPLPDSLEHVFKSLI